MAASWSRLDASLTLKQKRRTVGTLFVCFIYFWKGIGLEKNCDDEWLLVNNLWMEHEKNIVHGCDVINKRYVGVLLDWDRECALLTRFTKRKRNIDHKLHQHGTDCKWLSSL